METFEGAELVKWVNCKHATRYQKPVQKEDEYKSWVNKHDNGTHKIASTSAESTCS